MAEKEDDDKADQALGVGMYPVMPSLVGLQQMKNRLNLAQLGKKLMKWTAMATGRELRRVAEDLAEKYGGLCEDIRHGYLTLARCRYVEPGFNQMVLENVPTEASISVESSVKTVSGVRTLHFEIADDGRDPFPHILMAKSAETLRRAKEAWREMVVRLIAILELRESFMSIEAAHKNATKRQNVLGKVVIPKTKNTIKYIKLEIEEVAREELYRIKKIKQKKQLKSAKEKGKLAEKEKPTISQIEVPSDTDQLEIEPSDLVCNVVSAILPGTNTIEKLKERLLEVIGKSRSFMESKLNSIDMKEFLIKCEEVKARIDKMFAEKERTSDHTEQICPICSQSHDMIDEYQNNVTESQLSLEDIINSSKTAEQQLDSYMSKLNGKPVSTKSDNLKNISSHIADLEGLAQEFKGHGIVTTDIDKFVDSCRQMQRNIKDTNAVQRHALDSKHKKDHLKVHIEGREDLETDLKCKVVPPEINNTFLSACRDFKAKIMEYLNQPTSEHASIAKLKNQLNEAIALSQEAQQIGLFSVSIENFIKSCETVKKHLEEKDRLMKRKIVEKPSVLSELKNNINDVIDLVTKLKNDGLITESIEEFIKHCEITRDKITLYQKVPLEALETEGRMIFKDEAICKDACKKCDTTQGHEPDFSKRFKNIVKHIDTESQLESLISTSSNEPEISSSKHSDYAQHQRPCNEDHESNSMNSDNSIGYFESTVRKIVKVVRYQNPDGTISEERQTVTIRQETHDPNKMTIGEDPEDYIAGGSSYESVINRDNSNTSSKTKKVGYCSIPDFNQKGFRPYVRMTKSESYFKVYPLVEPVLRQCMSLVCSKTNQQMYSIVERIGSEEESREFLTVISYSDNSLYS